MPRQTSTASTDYTDWHRSFIPFVESVKSVDISDRCARVAYLIPAALATSAARSVFSQVNSGSLRPKWPPEAVSR